MTKKSFLRNTNVHLSRQVFLFVCRIHTYMMMVLAQKKIKIQNKAELTRNSAPMLASFLVNSALFCILIFFSARTIIIYVCGGIREKISKEVTKSERMCHKNNYFLLKKCMHCLYTKVRQNYFPFEQLSALVYTSRWQPRDFRPMFCKSFTVQ